MRFHAGAVERDGQVVLVVGQSGAGKSTLTAALTVAGFRYLTDEVVSVDPDGLRAHPYCRPLELDEAACASLGIRGRGGLGGEHKVQVPPGQLGTVSTGGRVALVVVLTDDPHQGDDASSAAPVAAGTEALKMLLPMLFADTFDSPDAFARLALMSTQARVVTHRRRPIPAMVSTITSELARLSADSG